MRRFPVSLFGASFLLNFVWEVTQAPLYAPIGLGTRDLVLFIAIRWWASFGDALTVLAAYAATAFLFRDPRWGEGSRAARWAFFLGGLTAWQAAVEYIAVYVWHAWAYSAFMPTIIGVGAAPLLQMLTLAPAAVLLSRRRSAEQPRMG